MFDFAADARDEGGSRGRNNKGLVTYDRKIKKDAFYVYKAWWSKQPFVHVAGRRFTDRAPGQRDIKVYSNQPEVTLLLNGVTVGTQTGSHVFVFPDVPLQDGPNTITARHGTLEDTITLNGVAQPNPDYVLPGQEDTERNVANWFADIQADGEMEYPEGFFSLRDTIGDLMANPDAAALIQKYAAALFGSMAKSLENMSGNTGMIDNMPLEEAIQFSGAPLEEKTPEIYQSATQSNSQMNSLRGILQTTAVRVTRLSGISEPALAINPVHLSLKIGSGYFISRSLSLFCASSISFLRNETGYYSMHAAPIMPASFSSSAQRISGK